MTSTGDTQNTRLNTTGDTQDKRLNDLGQKYVDLMTTLKDTATTKATEAGNSAELSKKWAMSDTSPDGVTENKSAKTWAGEAKTSASNSATSASASQSSASASSASATQSSNSASASKSSASASASSASASAASASAASTSASNAKTSETNAANSAAAAKASADRAATFDPSSYYMKTETYTKEEVDNKIKNNKPDLSSYYTKTEVDAKIPTKTSQLTNDSGFVTKDDAPSINISSGKTSSASDAYENRLLWDRYGNIVTLNLIEDDQRVQLQDTGLLCKNAPLPVRNTSGVLTVKSIHSNYFSSAKIVVQTDGQIFVYSDLNNINLIIASISLTYVAK